MSSWRQQAVVDAPVEDVWTLIGDPGRYPQFMGKDIVEVTGLPQKVERNRTFRQVMKLGLRAKETTMRIEEYEGLREIKLRCLTSGYYSHWLLTDAQGETFIDVEHGIEPTTLRYRVESTLAGKRFWRQLTERALDGVRHVVGRD